MPLPDEAEKQPPKLIEYEGSIEWACYRLRHASGAAIIMPRLEGVQIGHAMPNDDDDHEWFFPAWVEDPPRGTGAKITQQVSSANPILANDFFGGFLPSVVISHTLAHDCFQVIWGTTHRIVLNDKELLVLIFYQLSERRMNHSAHAVGRKDRDLRSCV